MNYLFFGVCIPIRLLLVYLASTLNKNNLRFFGIFLLVIALGFLYLYFANNNSYHKSKNFETTGALSLSARG